MVLASSDRTIVTMTRPLLPRPRRQEQSDRPPASISLLNLEGSLPVRAALCRITPRKESLSLPGVERGIYSSNYFNLHHMR